jgi:predicted DNA-binding transcriptional regulator YafY
VGNLHRIQWFDQQIRAGHYPNSSKLAECFEISKRQAQRDIEYMAASLRAPLLYVAAKRGYRYEDEAYVLPNLYLTEEEKKVLKYLAHRYRHYNYDGSRTINRIAGLLGSMLPEAEDGEATVTLPVFDADPLLIERMELLSFAARHRRSVEISESRDSAAPSRRIVLPLQIVTRYNADYVRVRNMHDGAEQLLRLDRIAGVTVTNDTFDPGEPEAPDEQFNGRWTSKPFTAVLLIHGIDGFKSWNGYPVRKSPDGASDLYEVRFFDAEAFMQHLLTSEWEKLMSPKWLIARLNRKIEAVAGRLKRQE